jgi:hypothetical protein
MVVSISSIRSVAERELADTQGGSSKVPGPTHEERIHDLQVHQIDLEAQVIEIRRT